ncbi:hypothetical protein LR48_Vigan04g143200 [Vigna angularis]|uniref:Uncharacterized protein n=1 Tax=Phaseolus angularis TaxID=3914 RepID=A0A0L9UFB6_PHAAN|nr:hypothetical protein LR48_Vigan04g143200 [Vigna angularis]
MVTTRNMSMDDPMEMIRMLQQKIEEMQQRHEAELIAVRAECSARIAREGAGEKGEGEQAKERGKATMEDQAEHSSGPDKMWKPTELEVEGSKAKSVHVKSVAGDKQMSSKRNHYQLGRAVNGEFFLENHCRPDCSKIQVDERRVPNGTTVKLAER